MSLQALLKLGAKVFFFLSSKYALDKLNKFLNF